MERNEYIHSIKGKAGDAGSGVSSIEISAKALKAARLAKRKKTFLTSFLVGCSVTGISFFFLRPADEPTRLLAGDPIAETTEATYFNEWPAEVMTQSSRDKFKDPAVNANLHQEAESTKVITAVSEKSVLSASKNKETVSPETMAHIKTELMQLHSVSFSKGAEEKNVLMAANGTVQHPELLPPVSKKNFSWFVGVGFNPQASNYQIGKNNPAKFTMYDGELKNTYAAMYLNNLKNQSNVYSYSASVKGGFVYKDKWMVQGSAGFQSFRYTDKPDAAPLMSTPAELVSSRTLAANSSKYMNFSVEASRLFQFKHVGLRTGLSFSASRLITANTVVADGPNTFSLKRKYRGVPLSKWMCAPGIHVGLVKNFSSRVQMQASPNLYYNISSMFNKHYLVSQKPYGVGLDLSLMIRIN